MRVPGLFAGDFNTVNWTEHQLARPGQLKPSCPVRGRGDRLFFTGSVLGCNATCNLSLVPIVTMSSNKLKENIPITKFTAILFHYFFHKDKEIL